MILRNLEILDVVSQLVPGFFGRGFFQLEDDEVHEQLRGTILADNWVIQGFADAVHFVFANVADFKEHLVVWKSITDIWIFVVAFEI